MSQALRKLTGVVSKTKTVVVFINQIRNKIGVFFGNPETTSGGNALKFYSSVRVEVRRSAQIKQGEKIIGNRVKAKVVKNKVAPPYRQAEFTMLHGEGISKESCLIEMGVENKVIEKSGSWYIYNEEKLGQGADNARQYLKDNPEVANEIEAKLREMFIGTGSIPTSAKAAAKAAAKEQEEETPVETKKKK
jgi:recombination protein RecA